MVRYKEEEIMRLRLPNKTSAVLLPFCGLVLGGCSTASGGGENSLGELFAAAGTNTIIGMGTVFAVLVFLTWVISLFKHIPRIQKRLAEQKRQSEGISFPPKKAPSSGKYVPANGMQTAAVKPAPGIAAGKPEEELQAVIAAAIAAYEADRKNADASVSADNTSKPRGPRLQNGINIRAYRREGRKGGKR